MNLSGQAAVLDFGERERRKLKDFVRDNLWFSLCGLNCGLCPMKLDGHCTGCGGGEGNQSCKIAKCSIRHGKIEYCNQCQEFPCDKYGKADEYDIFITHRNWKQDFEKMKELGVEAYNSEQMQKLEIWKLLLEGYNDGRRKSFFCLAVNLLDLEDLKTVMEHLAEEKKLESLTLKEKSAYVVKQFQSIAEQRGVVLKWNRKPSKPKK